jgi:hypothetical protein
MSGANGATAAKGRTPKGTAAGNKKKRIAKKKTSASYALVKSELGVPRRKIVEWRSKSEERWSVGSAKVQEKLAHCRASMIFGVYIFTHILHPVRQMAARQSMVTKKAAATGKSSPNLYPFKHLSYFFFKRCDGRVEQSQCLFPSIAFCKFIISDDCHTQHVIE